MTKRDSSQCKCRVNRHGVKMKFCLAEGISPPQSFLEESVRIHQPLNLSGDG